MLESVKKLRDVATDFGMPLIYLLQDAYNSDTATGALLIACDEINREISEHYIERDKAIEAPVDANGVVWKYDDDSFIDPQGKKNTLTAMKINYLGKWMLRSALGWYHADSCYHVKQRTIEDVLIDYRNALESNYQLCVRPVEDIDKEYANELRSMFGGDA